MISFKKKPQFLYEDGSLLVLCMIGRREAFLEQHSENSAAEISDKRTQILGLKRLTMAVPHFGQMTLPLAGFLAVLDHVGHPGCRSDRDLSEHLLGVIEVNCQDHLQQGNTRDIDHVTAM